MKAQKVADEAKAKAERLKAEAKVCLFSHEYLSFPLSSLSSSLTLTTAFPPSLPSYHPFS